jgi:hypothetical protein
MVQVARRVDLSDSQQATEQKVVGYLERELNEVDSLITKLVAAVDHHEQVLNPVLGSLEEEKDTPPEPEIDPDTLIGQKLLSVRESLRYVTQRLYSLTGRTRV